MDPNEALGKARVAAGMLRVQLETDSILNRGEVEELVRHFAAIDGWLSHGGFLPDDWRHGLVANMDSAERADMERQLGQFDDEEV